MYSKRTLVAVVATCCGIMGAAAPAAHPAPSPGIAAQPLATGETLSPAEVSGLRLDNLKWVQRGQLGGPPSWRLVLDKYPAADGHGVFFTYDLLHEQQGSGFVTGDIARSTVESPSLVQIRRGAATNVAVMYGDPNHVEEALYIAGAYDSGITSAGSSHTQGTEFLAHNAVRNSSDTFDGRPLFRLISDADREDGQGIYFAYVPATAQVRPVGLGQHHPREWREVIFTVAQGERKTEIRYGDPALPDRAETVAWVAAVQRSDAATD